MSTAPGEAGVALEVRGLGRRYRRRWALRDTGFRLPAGRICGLVGPNGAGKTTLLEIVADLRAATTGEVRIFGTPAPSPEAARRIAFLSQEKPLFRQFTVAETLRLGRELNPGWDQPLAEDFVRAGGVRLDARVGQLSGGQRTRVAFALALGKRPDLLLLDEPMSDLDPLVRHELAAALMSETAARGTTVLMSTHLVSELDNVCDYLLLLTDGGLRVAGDVDEILSAHLLLTGAHEGPQGSVPVALARHTLVETRSRGRQFTALIRPDGPVDGVWETAVPTLEELVLAYLRQPHAPALISPSAHVPGTRPGAAA